MPNQYLQRLQIEAVEEVGVDTVLPQYQQIVQVVEVLDQNGDVWRPEPPVDDLAIADNGGASWANDNDYTIGETVTANTATFTGGLEPITYRYRWQTKDLSNDAWTNGAWTVTTNAANAVTFDIEGGGQFRLQSQAKDSSDPEQTVNSYTGIQTIAFPTLTVSTPVATGEPLVGETLTCAEPTVSGGLEPYTISYWWTNADTGSAIFENRYMRETLVLTEEDDGISYFCAVTVTSADSQTKDVGSNTIGPVLIPLLGTLTTTVDGSAYDHLSPPTLTTAPYAQHVLAVSIGGNAIRESYSWEVRQGQATITGSGSSVTVTITSDPPQGVQIQCNIRDDNASDSPKNYRTLFYVSD